VNATDFATIGSAIFAGVSALVAASAVYIPWKSQRDRELFTQAVLAMERAYAVLTDDGKNVAPAPINRYRWLTSARHIERFKLLRARIKSDLYALLCDEHQEYWRYRFNECLRPDEVESSEHFHYLDTGHRAGPNGVEGRSALVLFAFAGWQMGTKDPLDLIDVDALLRSSQGALHSRGLHELLRAEKQLREA
jgi:hypothetical protein